MANIITYNQVVELLTDIARRHYQVNTFYLGRNWELENSDDILYPLFQVYPDFGRLPINAFNEYKTQQIRFVCKVIDTTTPGEDNERDVHSDTLRIAQDIVNEFNQHPFYVRSNIKLIEDIDFTPLEEFKDDISAGWQFNLVFQIINLNTFCGMPIAEIPGFSATGPTSQGEIVNVKYLTCDTLTECPTIITIDETLIDLQEQIDNLPPSALTLAQVLGYGNSTNNISITSPDAFTFVNIFDGYFSIGYDNAGIGGYIRGNATEALMQYTSATTGGMLDIIDAHTLVNHDVLIDIIAPNVTSSATGTNTTKTDNGSYLGKIEITTKPSKAFVNDYTLNQISGYNSSIYNEANASDNIITIGSNNPTFAGAQYTADYSANYTNRSLVDKQYVDSLTPATPTLSSVLAVGNTSGANDIVMSTTRVIKSANGGGELGLDGGSYGTINTVYLTNDNNLFGKSYLSFDENSGGYANAIGLVANDTSTNSKKGTVFVGVYSSDVSAFKSYLNATSDLIQLIYKTASLTLNGTGASSLIALNASSTVVSSVLRMTANTANTLVYHDASKNLKSVTLGSGLSLVSGVLSNTLSLTGYVPYTGATSNVVLGANNLSAQSVTVTGTAGAGHVHLRHQSVDPTAGANNTAIFADVNGDIKYKNDSLYYTTFKTSLNTADRVYTFQDISGTIAMTSDITPVQTQLNKVQSASNLFNYYNFS